MPHTHEIEFVGGLVRKTFVSWAQEEPDREWAGLEHLDRHAPDLAPRPVSRLVMDGRPVVVMSRVPGEPLAGRVSTPQTRGLAEALRRLFAVPVPPGLPVRANEPLGFVERFRPWLAADDGWDRCLDRALVRAAVGASRVWLDRHPVPHDWIVDPVVALGDGNLDNVIWDGTRCRLLDWEEYGVSDLAYEVADVLEHASSRLERRLDVPLLLDGLALSDAQRDRVETHRPLFATFWLAMLLPGNSGWRRNPTGSAEDQARHVLHLLERSA